MVGSASTYLRSTKFPPPPSRSISAHIASLSFLYADSASDIKKDKRDALQCIMVKWLVLKFVLLLERLV
jgi:hypothetical protein